MRAIETQKVYIIIHLVKYLKKQNLRVFAHKKSAIEYLEECRKENVGQKYECQEWDVSQCED